VSRVSIRFGERCRSPNDSPNDTLALLCHRANRDRLSLFCCSINIARAGLQSGASRASDFGSVDDRATACCLRSRLDRNRGEMLPAIAGGGNPRRLAAITKTRLLLISALDEMKSRYRYSFVPTSSRASYARMYKETIVLPRDSILDLHLIHVGRRWPSRDR